jgi:hypothetical protein
VFVLCAASVALLVENVTTGTARRWLVWAAFNGFLLATCVTLWHVQARHMYYPGLKEHWRIAWNGFPPDHTWQALIQWSVRRFIGLGDYANTGLGVPLLLLAAGGTGILWRRSPPLTVLLAGPIAITFVAGLAEKYPFSDRTILFLAPCMWCLAMVGLISVFDHLAMGIPVLVPLSLAFLLLVAGLCKTIKEGIAPVAKLEYREALIYLHEHREPGDEAVVWCRHLHDVYFGHVFADWIDPAFDEAAPVEKLAHHLHDHTLWIVAPANQSDLLVSRVGLSTVREARRERFIGVDVVQLESAER